MNIIDDNDIDTNDTNDTTTIDTTEALGVPESSNDNGTTIATPDTTSLITLDSVVRYVAGTLRRYGVEMQDMPDADAGEWRALCTTIAARWATDGLREKEVADKYDAGLCDEPDAYVKPTLEWEGRDPVDTKRYLAVLKGLFDSGQMPEDGAEIIESAGVAVRKTVVRAARIFAAKVGTITGTAKLVAPAAARRSSYEWQYSADGGKTWAPSVVTLQAKTTILGLTAGSTVLFRYRPVLKTGEENWSQTVSLVVQ